MRAENIIDLIKRTTPFSETSLSELETLLKEYPYFQTARLLYLLNLQTLKDTQVSPTLKKTACYLSDRSKLFFLMEEDFFSPLRIQALNAPEEESSPSGFDLIDFFLKDKPEKTILADKEEKLSNKEKATSDYLSYLLSEDNNKEEKDVKPMQHQDLIDRFLSEDERNPIRIELKDEENEAIPSPFIDLDSVNESGFFS